jgi:hypothetical protein
MAHFVAFFSHCCVFIGIVVDNKSIEVVLQQCLFTRLEVKAFSGVVLRLMHISIIGANLVELELHPIENLQDVSRFSGKDFIYSAVNLDY